jgi:ElaB/YqjD/DUF883 family membrane-anchored ribosome-binding protein
MKGASYLSSKNRTEEGNMAETSAQLALGRAKINEDLRILAADTQELMRLTASASGEQLDVLRSRLNERLAVLKVRAAEAQDATRSNCKLAMTNADDYVRENPWQSVGVGVAVGVVLGALLAR